MNKKNKFGFVILNYKLYDDTILCAQSILRHFNNEEIHIVIVENGSGESIYNKLNLFFENESKIDVIYSKKNVGFARGHNFGIKYLQNFSDFDYIILLNNDTEIIGDNWSVVLGDKYEKHKFAVMGPDIIDLDGIHNSPMKPSFNTAEDIKLMIKDKERKLLKINFAVDTTVKFMKRTVKKIIKYKPIQNENYSMEQINVQLHGSCLILSRNFFEVYDELFSGTFLYLEEGILRYMCNLANLKILYSPEIRLLHKDGKATLAQVKNRRAKRKFYLIHSKESCENFLKWIESGKQNEE